MSATHDSIAPSPGTPLVSIVIDNYNYARFLPHAIESALGQRDAAVEVVVVDDGSTDDSRLVIERYADRVRPVLKENGGHASAINAGFAVSRGEIVIFLDADDYLYPDAARAVADARSDGCAKVQFRLSLVDPQGIRLGADPPHTIAMPSGDVVPRLLACGRYPTPVLSGNAYPRSLLGRILPAPEEELRMGVDGYLNAVAPFFGSIVSLDRELGAYRLHGANHWAFTREATADALRRRVEHDTLRERYIRRQARERKLDLSPGLVLRDWSHVLHRLSVLRLEPDRPAAPGDARLSLLRAGVRSLRRDPDLPAADRAMRLALVVAIAAVPSRFAPTFVPWAAGGGRRSRLLHLAARAMRGVGRASRAMRAGR